MKWENGNCPLHDASIGTGIGSMMAQHSLGCIEALVDSNDEASEAETVDSSLPAIGWEYSAWLSADVEDFCGAYPRN